MIKHMYMYWCSNETMMKREVICTDITLVQYIRMAIYFLSDHKWSYTHAEAAFHKSCMDLPYIQYTSIHYILMCTFQKHSHILSMLSPMHIDTNCTHSARNTQGILYIQLHRTKHTYLIHKQDNTVPEGTPASLQLNRKWKDSPKAAANTGSTSTQNDI